MGLKRGIKQKYSGMWMLKVVLNKLKKAMAHATLLYHPCQDAEVALVTDRSNFAISGDVTGSFS